MIRVTVQMAKQGLLQPVFQFDAVPIRADPRISTPLRLRHLQHKLNVAISHRGPEGDYESLSSTDGDSSPHDRGVNAAFTCEEPDSTSDDGNSPPRPATSSRTNPLASSTRPLPIRNESRLDHMSAGHAAPPASALQCINGQPWLTLSTPVLHAVLASSERYLLKFIYGTGYRLSNGKVQEAFHQLTRDRVEQSFDADIPHASLTPLDYSLLTSFEKKHLESLQQLKIPFSHQVYFSIPAELLRVHQQRKDQGGARKEKELWKVITSPPPSDPAFVVNPDDLLLSYPLKGTVTIAFAGNTIINITLSSHHISGGQGQAACRVVSVTDIINARAEVAGIVSLFLSGFIWFRADTLS